MKRFFAAALLLAVCISCAPLVSGCSASLVYTLNEAGDGYIVTSTGFPSSLKGELEIPAYYGEEGTEGYLPVKEIAMQGFSNARYTKVTIPATVEKMGNAAFTYCTSLKEVVFAEGSALSEVAWGAFGGCTSLTTVTVAEGIETIGGMVFYDCSSLRTVYLPSTLKSIGREAFKNCGSLSTIDLPEGLTTVGMLAFYNAGLTEIVLPSTLCDIVTESVNDEGESETTTVYGLGVGAFHSCLSLTRAVVSGTIERVTSGAFGYCTALREITLPATVKKIDGATYTADGTFYCGHAFHNNDALADVYFAGTQEEWGQIEIVTEQITLNGATYDNGALSRATLHFGGTD